MQVADIERAEQDFCDKLNDCRACILAAPLIDTVVDFSHSDGVPFSVFTLQSESSSVHCFVFEYPVH